MYRMNRFDKSCCTERPRIPCREEHDKTLDTERDRSRAAAEVGFAMTYTLGKTQLQEENGESNTSRSKSVDIISETSCTLNKTHICSSGHDWPEQSIIRVAEKWSNVQVECSTLELFDGKTRENSQDSPMV